MKPHPQAKVEPNARPFYTTHKGLVQGLTGPGLGPMSRRYIDGFARYILSYDGGAHSQALSSHGSGGWVGLPDLFHFVQHTAGSAMIASHFGPTLLRLHPNYVDDLWSVDAGIPWFARFIPRFVNPEPYRARDRMIDSLMDWYKYAREHFDEAAIDEDGDGDPVWGSSLNRYRQETLFNIKNHDDRAVASLDVGHSWGSVSFLSSVNSFLQFSTPDDRSIKLTLCRQNRSGSNVVSTVFMAVYHILTSPALLSRLRESISKTIGASRIESSASPGQVPRVSALLDNKILNSDPLLCAVYAEILRLHGMAHFLVSAPAWSDVCIGNSWILPRGRIGVLSSGISHSDATFWNTCEGEHPVTEFWIDRFLVDPKKPGSGPVAPAHREVPYTRPTGEHEREINENEPFFTMEGTEGHWFPYGGRWFPTLT